ncbi:AAA family ATPase [bacterium E08(2017)]|nr:AAA family ATPase [bacterium E08(2017)]
MDLFGQEQDSTAAQPLAYRMRPRNLDEIIGQEHILGEGRLLRRAVEADRISSLILYGPPGCGKTSLGEVIAKVTERNFEYSSGVTANVAMLREIITKADLLRRSEGRETILFVDEIHRFNKSQQDVLLPHVESGVVTLVGATTHNPMIFINNALTSRSLVFELQPLSRESIEQLLRRALDAERGLAAHDAEVDDAALAFIANICEGDARRALNALEIAVTTTKPEKDGIVRVTPAIAEDSIQKKMVNYDHDEDGHYDTISAFIKSVRGSDPHAAVYWLAKMLYAGEDPRFIARRLIILASEDIGNADPRGLTVAVAAMRAVEFVGMPEARIILSQATTYLATAPKSNASYVAVSSAMKEVKNGRSLKVPEHLKNVHVKAVDKEIDGYVYPHDYDEHFVEQEYVPTDSRFYEPHGEGYEEVIRKRMLNWKRL